MVVKAGLIAEELGRAPFLAPEWARSMLGAVRQDAYRVAAISERFGASRPGPQQWPSCRTRASITAIRVWFVKGFRGADLFAVCDLPTGSARGIIWHVNRVSA